MSADASFSIPVENGLNQFLANSVSVEYDLSKDNIFIFKSNISFFLPMIDYAIDFDLLTFDLNVSKYSRKGEAIIIIYKIIKLLYKIIFH